MKTILLTGALALLAATTAHASGILSDSFNYPNGPLTEAPASPPWVAHSSPGNGPVLVTNSQIRLSGANQESVHVLLPGGPYTSNNVAALYASFKVKVTSAPGFNGAYFAHFKDTNTLAASGFGARIWISATNTVAGGALPSGKFRFGIGNGVLATNSSGQIDTDLSLNTTNLLVSKFVPGTGVATIWLNPTAELDPNVTATDPGTVSRPNPLDVVAYAFHQASGEGAMLIDDLRIGTAFADVAGTNHPPLISTIAPQRTAAGAPIPAIPFTVGDAETAAENLLLTGSSSNPSLVVNSNIVFGGSGSNRTVTVTPEAGEQGFTAITITVADADNAFSSTSFQLEVGVPTISAIPNQITSPNTPLGPIFFTVDDTETPASGLMVTASSGNPTLLPNTNIVLAGTGAQRSIALTPATNQMGLANVTVTVSDGVSSARVVFTLTVHPLLGLLRVDDFNRPDGPLVQLDGQWMSSVTNGNTNFQQTRISGNKLKLSAGFSEDCSTELPPNHTVTPIYTPTNGVVFYVSLKINYQVLPTAPGAYFAHFRDRNNGFRGRIYAATTGSAAGHYRVGVANTANSISSAGLIPTDLATNQSYTIVLRYNVGTGESHLWLGPVSESSPGIEAVDGPQPISIEAFTFRQNNGLGAVLVDDLKIGASFSDVLPLLLRIAFSVGDMQISWPANFGNAILQGSPSISSPDWATVTDARTFSDGNVIVHLSNVTSNRFFRLTQ